MAKILIVHHSGIIGGAGVSLINTVQLLAPDNELTIAVSIEPTDIMSYLENVKESLGINVIGYGRRIGAFTYYSGGDNIFSARLLYRGMLIAKQWLFWNKLVKDINPDIVIVNSVILSWMSLLKEVQKRKSICFVRETINGKLKSIPNRIIRSLLLKFNKVAFLSKYDKNSWQIPDKQAQIIRNSVNSDTLNTSISRSNASAMFGLREQSFHLLYVGGVSEMKGFDLAVKAVLQCKSDVELIVAGVSFEDRRKMGGGHLNKYEQAIKTYIAKNDHNNCIRLVGRQMNMSNCYAAADAVVFPMRSPHQARPVFEAGWYSLPVIITDFENIHESVQEGKNGLLFQSNDLLELKQKIDYLASNISESQRMGRCNREHTMTYHTTEMNNELIRKLILTLQ